MRYLLHDIAKDEYIKISSQKVRDMLIAEYGRSHFLKVMKIFSRFEPGENAGIPVKRGYIMKR